MAPTRGPTSGSEEDRGGRSSRRADDGAGRLRWRRRQRQQRRGWRHRHPDPGRDRPGDEVRRRLPLGERVAVHAGGLRHAAARSSPTAEIEPWLATEWSLQRRQDRADHEAAHRREVHRRHPVQRRRRGAEHPALPGRHLAQRVLPGQRQGRQGRGRRHPRDHADAARPGAARLPRPERRPDGEPEAVRRRGRARPTRSAPARTSSTPSKTVVGLQVRLHQEPELLGSRLAALRQPGDHGPRRPDRPSSTRSRAARSTGLNLDRPDDARRRSRAPATRCSRTSSTGPAAC